MVFKNLLAGLACTILTSTVAEAVTFKAYSHIEGGGAEHSLWINDGSSNGTTTSFGNHFLFESVSPGYGEFTTDGTNATLTGKLKNAAGYVFDLMLAFTKTGDPGVYKDTNGIRTDWTFYTIDAGSMINFVSGPAAHAGYNVAMRGSIGGSPLAVQVGTGANDKNALLFGLSTWIGLTDKSCTANCSTTNADINIILGEGGNGIPSPVPLPAAGLLLLGGLGGLGFLARRKRKTAA